MNKDTQESNPDQLEACLSQLLRGQPPEQPLPAAVRDRIRADLVKAAQAAGNDRSTSVSRRKTAWKYFKVLIPAAAALLVLAAALFWPTRTPSGVVWADVVRNLAKIQSMKCVVTSTTVSPEGAKERGASRYYFRYPRCWRLDFYPYPLPEDFDPVNIDRYDHLIWKIATVWTKADQFIATIVEPKAKKGIRIIEKYVDSGTSWPNQNLADEVFLDFSQVISGPARKIGTKEIHGVRTDGYEFSASDIPWKTEWIGYEKGIGRLWVSTQDALPVEAEFEFDLDGNKVFKRYQDMVWNEPIPDDIFRAASFQDCKFSEEHRTMTRRIFEKTHFKPGVQFLITSSDGQNLVSGDDVEEVESGIAERFPVFTSMWLTIHLKKEAYQRLGLNKKLTVIFDGRKLSGEKGNPRQYNFCLLITPLSLTLEQFEEKYLVTAEAKGGLQKIM